MARAQEKLASRFPRAETRGVKIVGLDGRVIHAEDPAARLNRLIDEALGRERFALRGTPDAPVDISSEDADENEALLLEVRAALNYARRAS